MKHPLLSVKRDVMEMFPGTTIESYGIIGSYSGKRLKALVKDGKPWQNQGETSGWAGGKVGETLDTMGMGI